MLDTIVQLIRNALCVIKGLGWWEDTLWYDVTVLPQYYDLPEPLNQTTPLELLIGLTQVYVTFSLCPSGWSLFSSSGGKYVRIQRILYDRQDLHNQKNNNKTTSLDHANHLVHASLIKEAQYALRSMLVGLLLMANGGSFFWLFTNSIHLTETGWNGGIHAVIHALIVTEVALLPLLGFMWQDGTTLVQKSQTLTHLATLLEQQPASTTIIADVELVAFEALTEWVPFWDAGLSLWNAKVPDPKEEEKLVAQEVTKVQGLLHDLTTTNAQNKTKTNNSKKDDGDKNDTTTSYTIDKEHAATLKHQSLMQQLQGYREFVFWGLNAVAFCSYLICIVVFYYHEESAQPYWMRSILLQDMDNALADWHGNFWGDLMWTIEPLVVLVSSAVFFVLKQQHQRRTTSKLKTD